MSKKFICNAMTKIHAGFSGIIVVICKTVFVDKNRLGIQLQERVKGET